MRPERGAPGRGPSPARRFHQAEARASAALEVLRETGTRLDEPAALAALAAAERLGGREDLAASLDQRWRRQTEGMGAPGLEAWIERSIPRPAAAPAAVRSDATA